jgi:hypothetical protein
VILTRVYRSTKKLAFHRVKDKIRRRKLIKSPYIVPLVEHEAFQKDSLFKESNFDFCFFKRPTFNLNMVLQVKKERNSRFSNPELEKLMKHQVGLG